VFNDDVNLMEPVLGDIIHLVLVVGHLVLRRRLSLIMQLQQVEIMGCNQEVERGRQ
jgi:hypothetical protein